jgi:type IV pilus assembly protein PilB
MDYLVEKRAGNIITVEDPVEYEMSGISQVEVDSRDKVNFGKALRSLLRHDPDVVMIGEIRDQETADIAIQASLTGHLVFSTLHTNDAVGVVSRLVEMGVQPYLLAVTLRLAIAQRLVRRLCDHCKSPRATTAQEVELFHRPELENATVFEPRGCVYCAGKGYVGRIAIFELMPVHDTIAECIARSAAETDIRQYLYSIANKSLADDAIQKLIRGITSMDDARSAILARG